MTIDIQELKGHRIENIYGSYFLHDGVVDEEITAVWLSTSSLPEVRLSGCSDGTIKVDGTRPLPIDMGSSGEFIIRDISELSHIEGVRFARIISIETQRFGSSDAVAGYTFHLDNGYSLSVLNHNDEIYIGRDIPEDFQVNQ